MGSDKALFRIEGEAMISRIANALSSANLEPIRVAVSRPEDVENYGAEIQGDIELEWVLDGESYAGPIEAILEALIDPKIENCEVLQLAPVDCPWVTKELFFSLREGIGEDDSLIMPHDGERSHPLLALVRPDRILKLIDSDRRPLHKQFSETKHSLLVEDPRVLKNINSVQDL
ncbi:MAG: hypothetical protein CMA00_003665 [Methanobacteriota archaeon]|nr:MAG: hypothetical protein CMA00_003665 [Euryarchaeota archaeon]|tara:strand:+ start:110 stop:631 length:522 start_codon:yes stop_codon:yes gene_type:complete